MTRQTGTNNITNTITERKGVCEIEKKCCEIKWVFRERGHSDFGIDADMEESVIENKVPKLTNRHIAVQIKSGDSYFKFDKKKQQYYFTIPDSRIANYWLGSDRPVILMVYNNKDKKVYWAQIKPSNIQKINHNKSSESTKEQSYGKVYLNKIFTKKSAKEFSDIISTYIPTFDSQLVCPSIILHPGCMENNSQKLFDLMNRVVGMIDDVNKSVSWKTYLYDEEGNQCTDNSVYYEIEICSLVLTYGRNILNLLLTRYTNLINQLKEINYFGLKELNNTRKEAVKLTSSSINEITSLLQVTKNNIKDVDATTDSYISIINQTNAIIEDFICMLKFHLSELEKASL